MLGREFFKKPKNALEGQKGPAAAPQAPDGMFVKCPACGANLLREELERDNLVCKRCPHGRAETGRAALRRGEL